MQCLFHHLFFFALQIVQFIFLLFIYPVSFTRVHMSFWYFPPINILYFVVIRQLLLAPCTAPLHPPLLPYSFRGIHCSSFLVQLFLCTLSVPINFFYNFFLALIYSITLMHISLFWSGMYSSAFPARRTITIFHFQRSSIIKKILLAFKVLVPLFSRPVPLLSPAAADRLLLHSMTPLLPPLSCFDSTFTSYFHFSFVSE